MTKRLLALFLVCILAIPILVVPASATGYYTGDYDYSIYQYLVRLTDVFVKGMSDTLDSIDGWCDTLWQEIRNQRVWQEVTLGSALDTINNNIIAFNSNVDLWIEAQTELLVGWLEVIDTNITGFVEVFFVFWEDWTDKIADFKTTVELWFSEVWSTVNDFKNNALEYLRQLVNGSPEQEQNANDFGEIADDQFDEFFDNKEVIDDWTRPDYESDFDPSVEGITDGMDIGEYTSALYVFFDISAYLTTILFMAFSFSVISFVVFGKR